jgi:hypothetical protein
MRFAILTRDGLGTVLSSKGFIPHICWHSCKFSLPVLTMDPQTLIETLDVYLDYSSRPSSCTTLTAHKFCVLL